MRSSLIEKLNHWWKSEQIIILVRIIAYVPRPPNEWYKLNRFCFSDAAHKARFISIHEELFAGSQLHSFLWIFRSFFASWKKNEWKQKIKSWFRMKCIANARQSPTRRKSLSHCIVLHFHSEVSQSVLIARSTRLGWFSNLQVVFNNLLPFPFFCSVHFSFRS